MSKTKPGKTGLAAGERWERETIAWIRLGDKTHTHGHSMHSRNWKKFSNTRAQTVMRKETREVDRGKTMEGIYISKTMSQFKVAEQDNLLVHVTEKSRCKWALGIA